MDRMPEESPTSQLDVLMARKLALEAGSAITAPPAASGDVLVNTIPIEEFLLAGHPGYIDMRARVIAVRRHLENLRQSLAAMRSCTGNPTEFLRAAEEYRQYLQDEDRCGRYRVIALFRPVLGLEAAQLYAILREADGSFHATVSRMAQQLGTHRETVSQLIREAEDRGLVRMSGKDWPAGDGDEPSWILCEGSRP